MAPVLMGDNNPFRDVGDIVERLIGMDFSPEVEDASKSLIGVLEPEDVNGDDNGDDNSNNNIEEINGNG